MRTLQAIFLFVLLVLPGRMLATHIVGGNIHYEHLGNQNYLIELKVYRDCATSMTNFDDPAAIGVFNAAGNLVMNITFPLAQAVITDVPVTTGNSCLDAPSGICVKEAIYSTTVNLPLIPGGYTLTYQRCCRNTTLVNTVSNDDLGMTIYAQIPGSELTDWNSNPYFNEYPPVIICMNQPFVFDHSATDPDGDQLVYEFCNPLLTNVPGFYINPPGAPPYPELVFIPGYSAAYPIASDPAFAIDPATGLLTGTPNQLGQYVVGICVKEYRNGQLISTTNRDFQFNVALCNVGAVAAIPAQTSFCDGLEVFFSNNSINADSYLWDFGVPGTDEDISTEEEPVFAYPDTGSYVITLIANPGTICADTAVTMYTAYPLLDPEILTTEGACINGEYQYAFTANPGTDSDGTWMWVFGPDASPPVSTSQNPSGVIFPPGTHTVSFTASDNGCEETIEVEIIQAPLPEAIIDPQESFCGGFTYTFTQSGDNVTESLWDFGLPGNADQSAELSPTFTFPGNGEYIITLTVSSPGNCPQTTTAGFGIYAAPVPFFSDPGSQCLDGNSFDFTGTGASVDEADYQWEFGGPASIPDAFEPNVFGVSWSTPGIWPVTLTITEGICETTYTDSVWIALPPEIGISVTGAEGCVPLTVLFENTTTSETPVNYVWNFGNGSQATTPSTQHTYTEPGVYDVTLTAVSAVGCITTITEIFESLVQVYPGPMAGFVFDAQNLDFTIPVVDVMSVADSSLDCFYETSDGATYDDCMFTHAFAQSGIQWVTQTVVNEYGCVAQITGYVTINGFTFYAPNSFTPNGDGLNEGWRPEAIGLSEYRIDVFNRWGDVIFSSSDPEEYWTGNVHHGAYFAQDGVYVWRAVVKDLLGYPHDFEGHVVLLR
jgi:gliding motility-associated-like protein